MRILARGIPDVQPTSVVFNVTVRLLSRVVRWFFSRLLATRLVGKNVSEMTYLLSGGT